MRNSILVPKFSYQLSPAMTNAVSSMLNWVLVKPDGSSFSSSLIILILSLSLVRSAPWTATWHHPLCLPAVIFRRSCLLWEKKNCNRDPGSNPLNYLYVLALKSWLTLQHHLQKSVDSVHARILLFQFVAIATSATKKQWICENLFLRF